MIRKYSKTCLKLSLKNRQNKGLKDRWSLNAGQKYCRMLPWSILQYFGPALSDYQSRKLLGTSLIGRFRQVLLYHNYTLQTNPGHCEEEPQNTDCHKTSGRQLK